MAELQPAHYTQGACHTARGDRMVLSSLAGPGVKSLNGGGDLQVTAGSGMAVNVATGSAFVEGSSVARQGLYHVVNDSTTALTLTPSNPTNPRNDLIIARVKDSAYAGALNEWKLEVVTGTPAPSPSDPAVPASSLVLARVRVNAGAVTPSVITDLRKEFVTDPNSGLSTARPGSPVPGTILWETDTSRLVIWTGSAWVTVYDAARSAQTTTGSGTLGTSFINIATVTVPAGNWLIVGKGTFEWSVAATGPTCTAEIYNGASSVDSVRGRLQTMNGLTPFAVAVTVSPAVSTTYALRAKTDTLSGTQLVTDGRITAAPIP